MLARVQRRHYHMMVQRDTYRHRHQVDSLYNQLQLKKSPRMPSSVSGVILAPPALRSFSHWEKAGVKEIEEPDLLCSAFTLPLCRGRGKRRHA